MTREEIIRDCRENLQANDVCELFGVNPQSIRDQAHEDREKLGFNVVVIGRNVFIPRMAFIKYMGWEVAS